MPRTPPTSKPSASSSSSSPPRTPLKDIGGRDQRLFDSVIIDHRETASLGKGHLINAIDRLLELNGRAGTADIAFGILAQFEISESDRLSPQCLQSIRALF